MINKGFWDGRKVFLTGHTGFKGTWLGILLRHLNADVKGYALKPNTESNIFDATKLATRLDSVIGDMNDFDGLCSVLQAFEPEIVFHLAAQPLISESYLNPIDTFSTNIMGTAHLLEAIRNCPSTTALVNITTDKVYKNQNWLWPYRENDELGGHDPYSSSKACSEIIAESYMKSFLSQKGTAVACARSGNVIGGGDWSTNRLLPDILKAFEESRAASIRNPMSVRPWQHVLDPLIGYLVLAEKIFYDPEEFSGAWNFGPEASDNITVRQIVEHVKSLWPGNSHVETKEKLFHETDVLKLDNSKAKSLLNWQPMIPIKDALKQTVEWHHSWLEGKEMFSVTERQISNHLRLLDNDFD